MKLQSPKTLAVIVPTFNEQAAIASTIDKLSAVLARLTEFDSEIIVVDDGSTDGTAAALDKITNVTVLTHERNAGYGAALRTGIQHCRREWVAIIDADGTYPIDELPTLVRLAAEGHDMVVGARQGAGITSAPLRRLARALLRRLVFTLTGVKVPDLNSGMRVFRRAVFEQFDHLLPSGFSFTSTITVASLYRGFSVRYLPIPYFHRQGKSHIKPYRDFINFVILIVRIASYFEPLRFFLPMSFFLGALAGAKAIRDLWVLGKIGSLAVIVGLTSIQVFVAGVLADVMVRHFSGLGAPAIRRMTRLRPANTPLAPTVELPRREAR